MTPVVDLEVLQSGKGSSATFLDTFEWPFPCMDSDVGDQLVLGVEWFGQTAAVLNRDW